MSGFRFARTRNATSGFSLIEVIFASAIMVMTMSLTTAAMMYTLRSNKAQRTTLQQVNEIQSLQRTIRQFASSANNFITNNGNILNIIQPDKSEATLTFLENGTGTADNTLMWDPDTSVDGNEQIIARGVQRLTDANGNTVPFFTQPNGSRSLRVRFAMGDVARSSTSSAYKHENAHTGIGYQGFQFDSLFAARNSTEQ